MHTAGLHMVYLNRTQTPVIVFNLFTTGLVNLKGG